jgi:hypothetical protein
VLPPSIRTLPVPVRSLSVKVEGSISIVPLLTTRPASDSVVFSRDSVPALVRVVPAAKVLAPVRVQYAPASIVV